MEQTELHGVLEERKPPKISVAGLSPAGPERPIRSLREDRLGRDGFIRRLYAALINENTGTSTGVVVGVTGPWGSGKSSLLNILHEHIAERYPKALVVRFDPWMVAGRNDLVGKFFSELLGTINAAAASRDMTGLATQVAEYGTQLSPVETLASSSGIGQLLSSGIKATQRVLNRDTSLYLQRQRLAKTLETLHVPIVVLIDELDRLEDQEIRVIAQIVRSIADFPSLSYVLAYDAERVIQALGGRAGDPEWEERGRAYLEKIVQLQIPLPITLPIEIQRLLVSELVTLEAHLSLPENWQEIDRFHDLVSLLVPGVIANPRDVKRLIGTYHAIGGMVKGEVDWLGLLGFCALLIKAPKTIENIRRNPEVVVDDPATPEEQAARAASRSKKPHEVKLGALVPDDETDKGLIDLLGHLFPVLSENRTASETVSDAISLRLPLWKTMRLGLLPEDYSRVEIMSFVTGSVPEMKTFLKLHQRTRGLEGLLTRLVDLYPDLEKVDHAKLWEALSAHAEKTGPEYPTSYDPVRDYARDLAGVIRSLCARRPQFRDQAKRIFQDMVHRGDTMMPAHLIRYHVFAHGVFGRTKRGAKDTFLTEKETLEGIKWFGQKHRDGLLKEGLMSRLVDLTPIYNMVDGGLWDSTCRAKLTQLISDSRLLDAMALWLYGAYFKTDRAVVDKIVDADEFERLLRARLAKLGQSHETVRIAYKKALAAERAEKTA